MNQETTRARLSVIASMCIFGTIGLLRRYLPLPSGFLAMARGLLGALFLCLLLRLRGKSSPVTQFVTILSAWCSPAR